MEHNHENLTIIKLSYETSRGCFFMKIVYTHVFTILNNSITLRYVLLEKKKRVNFFSADNDWFFHHQQSKLTILYER